MSASASTLSGGMAAARETDSSDYDPFDVAVGERLRRLREARGMLQEDIARLLAKGQSTVSAYEKGRHALGPRQIDTLCRLFQVTADQFLGRTPMPPERYLES